MSALIDLADEIATHIRRCKGRGRRSWPMPIPHRFVVDDEPVAFELTPLICVSWLYHEPSGQYAIECDGDTCVVPDPGMFNRVRAWVAEARYQIMWVNRACAACNTQRAAVYGPLGTEYEWKPMCSSCAAMADRRLI